ncbi:unnamed protein product [Porites evermanni]|uniref:Uncharacterized protein n=1 Tax=Porites evermanni TaxID=104178 RepID=A0ABN8QKS7_9CNID|nr:unnamed protein product [Porites evermanni]
MVEASRRPTPLRPSLPLPKHLQQLHKVPNIRTKPGNSLWPYVVATTKKFNNYANHTQRTSESTQEKLAKNVADVKLNTKQALFKMVKEEALLKAAQDKHSRHFKQFDQHLDYVLLYPDQTIVQTLPGSSVLFPLNKYKEELEKPFSKLYFWLCSTSDVQSCIDFLEEESEQSSELGPSYISDTATTALEVKERDGSLRASNCPVKTSPSTNRARKQHLSNLLEEIEAHAYLFVDLWVDPVGELESDGEQEFIGTEELSCDEHASDERWNFPTS